MSAVRAAVLADALKAIKKGNVPPGPHDPVVAAIQTFGEAGFAEAVFEAAPPEVPWRVLADLFAYAIWRTSDNGTAIMRTAEQWLREASDLRRAFIALNLDAYPFLRREEMERVLGDVMARLPETATRCSELIESRRKLRE